MAVPELLAMSKLIFYHTLLNLPKLCVGLHSKTYSLLHSVQKVSIPQAPGKLGTFSFFLIRNFIHFEFAN